MGRKLGIDVPFLRPAELATDEALVDLDVARGGLDVAVQIEKGDGEPLGLEVSSAVFDRVRTCDNHCEFCFIYQLIYVVLLFKTALGDIAGRVNEISEN